MYMKNSTNSINLAIGIGDESGFVPPISQPHEALDLWSKQYWMLDTKEKSNSPSILLRASSSRMELMTLDSKMISQTDKVQSNSWIYTIRFSQNIQLSYLKIHSRRMIGPAGRNFAKIALLN